MNHPLHRRDVLKAGAAAFAAGSLGLSSTAFAADPYADAVLVDGEAPAMEEGSFTIVVLPDTQNYSEKFPDNFVAQTKWIAENKAARNVACVLHLGDITNRNTPAEWENAIRAMSLLDDAGLPYVMVPGNHDYSEGGRCTDRTTKLNEYFPLAKRKFTGEDVFGAYDKEPDRAENTYRLFSVGGRDFVAIGLEFGPRRDVVRWANEIAAAHPDREAILLTHAYMYYDDTRYDWEKYGTKQNWNPHSYGVAKATNDDVLDGEELWNELVSRHENFVMTLNGHVLQDGVGRIATPTPAGRDVHQNLVNFQMRPQGGDGWLRLLEFKKDGSTVDVVDYSPTRNQHNTSPQNQFTLTLAKPKV